MFREQCEAFRHAVQQLDGCRHLALLVGDPDPIALCDPNLLRVGWIEPKEAVRLNLEQALRPGRELAGMEQRLPNHERKTSFLLQAARRLPLACERVAACHILGVALAQVTVYHSLIEPWRGWSGTKKAIAWNQTPDLLQDLSGLAILKRIPHQHRQGGQDLPIRPAFANRLNGLAHLLHMSLGIRDGAVFLGIGAGRKDDVGERSGFGKEQFLADEKVELFERLCCAGCRWE